MRPIVLLSSLIVTVCGCGQQTRLGHVDAGARADAGSEDGASQGPGAGFFDPVSSQALLFSFQGRINPPSTKYEHLTMGEGSFEVDLGQGQSLTLQQDANVKAYQLPGDYPVEDLQGQRLLYLSAYKRDESGTGADPRAITIWLPVDALLKGKEHGQQQIAVPQHGAMTLSTYETMIRKDKVRLLKNCYLAVRDEKGGGKLYLEHGETSLKDGEVLRIWGNVAMTDRTEAMLKISPSLQQDAESGLYCKYYKGSTQITQKQYLDELTTSVELDCDLPEKVEKPPTDKSSHAHFVFKGTINLSGEVIDLGLGTFSVVLGGSELLHDSTTQYAAKTAYTFGTGQAKPAIGLLGVGEVGQVGPDRVTYKMVTVYLSLAELGSLSSTGELSCGAGCFVAVTENEEVQKGGITYRRICPKGINDQLEATSSSIFVCGEEPSFEVGDQLQIAATIVMTDDDATVKGAIGLPAGQDCYCLKGENYQVISCESYPAPSQGGGQ